MSYLCFSYADENSELKKKVVTLEQIVSIKEDEGSCWSQLGKALKLEEETLCDIRDEYTLDSERTFAVFQAWKEKERDNATVGLLTDLLKTEEKKDLAEKFLGR